MKLLLTPTRVFLRLSWVSERPASSSFTFVNKKKSTGAKSSDLGVSVISGIAKAANLFLTMVAAYEEAL